MLNSSLIFNLFIASIWERIDIVNLLIQAGADVNHRDYNGETSLMSGIDNIINFLSLFD